MVFTLKRTGSFLSHALRHIPAPGKWGLKRILIVSAIVISFVAITVVLFWLSPRLEALGRYGYLGVFLVTFLSSATVILPVPGLAVIFVAAATWNPLIVGLVGSVGGTLGEVTSYYLGYWGRATIITGQPELYQRAEDWMKRYGSVTVFFFALAPFLVFDLVGIAAGVLRFPMWKFLLACWLGRLPRGIIEAYIGLGVFHLIAPFLFR